MTIFRWAGGLCLFLAALLCSPALVMAQTTASSVQAPAGYAPMSAPCIKQADGKCVPLSATDPLPTAAKQESIALATANAAAAPATVYGGGYVFNQSCSGYNSGLLALRYRGADGATMVTLISRASSDSSGGTQLALGSGAVVDVTLPAGSTGCNATLSRIP